MTDDTVCHGFIVTEVCYLKIKKKHVIRLYSQRSTTCQIE